MSSRARSTSATGWSTSTSGRGRRPPSGSPAARRRPARPPGGPPRGRSRGGEPGAPRGTAGPPGPPAAPPPAAPDVVVETLAEYGGLTRTALGSYLRPREPRRHLYDLMADYPGRG